MGCSVSELEDNDGCRVVANCCETANFVQNLSSPSCQPLSKVPIALQAAKLVVGHQGNVDRAVAVAVAVVAVDIVAVDVVAVAVVVDDVGFAHLMPQIGGPEALVEVVASQCVADIAASCHSGDIAEALAVLGTAHLVKCGQ